MKKKIVITLLAAVIIALGFLREHIFISINYAIESGQDGNGELSILKWPLTFFFSIIYLALTCALIHVFFRTKKYTWISAFLFGAIFIIAFTAGISSYLFSSFDKSYLFIRAIMGIAQSPVPAIILFPSFLINEIISSGKKS